MIVHLRQIPDEGLHLEGEEDCPIAELENEDVVCAGPLRYSLDIGVSEGALWGNGSLAQPVKMRCVACLEQFDLHDRRAGLRLAHRSRRTGDDRPDAVHS